MTKELLYINCILDFRGPFVQAKTPAIMTKTRIAHLLDGLFTPRASLKQNLSGSYFVITCLQINSLSSFCDYNLWRIYLKSSKSAVKGKTRKKIWY